MQKNIIIKLVNFIFGAVLLGFAYLQLNDPDPVVWAGFYLSCAVVPFLGLFNKQHKLVFSAALMLCLITLGIYAEGGYIYYLHSTEEPLMQSMNPDKPYIEEAREFLGSLIALILISISYAVSKRKI